RRPVRRKTSRRNRSTIGSSTASVLDTDATLDSHLPGARHDVERCRDHLIIGESFCVYANSELHGHRQIVPTLAGSTRFLGLLPRSLHVLVTPAGFEPAGGRRRSREVPRKCRQPFPLYLYISPYHPSNRGSCRRR